MSGTLQPFDPAGPLASLGEGDGAAFRSADVGLQLAIGVLRGRWTLEHLDQPSQSHIVASRWREAHELPVIPHRNLAREWIDAHPHQWDALLRAELQRELSSTQPPAPLAA